MTEAEQKKFNRLANKNDRLVATLQKRDERRERLLVEVEDLSRIIRPRGVLGLVMCFINCAAAQEKVRVIKDILKA